jgi:hypothetical protein
MSDMERQVAHEMVVGDGQASDDLEDIEAL